MKNEINVNDQRKNLSLSNKAWDTIETDLENFNQYVESLSGLLNIVLENYSRYANVSINSKINEYERKLSQIITDKDSIELLCQEEKKKLILFVRELSQNTTSKRLNKEGNLVERKFRLNKKNYLIFESCDEVLQNYQGISRLYFNALFEEYSRLTEIERVKIIFREIIDDIEHSTNKKCCINITYDGIEQKNSFIPLGYYEAYNHLYLATTATENNKVINRIFRIERINKVEILLNEQFQLCDITSTINRIKEKGIFRALDKEITFVIELDEIGMSLFSKNSFNRPDIVKFKNNIYTIKTSQYDYNSYFKKFKNHVKLLKDTI